MDRRIGIVTVAAATREAVAVLILVDPRGEGIVPASGGEKGRTTLSAPDEHQAAGPQRGVKVTTQRPSRDRGRYPGIGRGIVLAAGTQIREESPRPTPDDHARAGPDSGVSQAR